MALFPEFSRLLTHYLAQRDRSPAWLARRLGVHPGTVNRWLNQATRPATPERVIDVADLLGVHSPGEREALLAAAGFAYQEGASTARSGDDMPASTANGAIVIESHSQLAPASEHQGWSKLPQAPTSFVGRDRELAQIVERLSASETRLVPLVGLGGMGKSRLAIEVARVDSWNRYSPGFRHHES